MAAAAVLAGLSLAGAYQDSVALSQQAANEKLKALSDAEVLKVNSDLKLQSGQEEYNAFLKKSKNMLGGQLAAQASGGVDVSYGTPASVRAGTELDIQLDANRIKNNATLEAFGLRNKAAQSIMQGESNAQALRNKAGATLLGGVLTAGAYGFQGMGKLTVPVSEDSGSGYGSRRSGKYYDTSGE